jgi:hypothetical protein
MDITKVNPCQAALRGQCCREDPTTPVMMLHHQMREARAKVSARERGYQANGKNENSGFRQEFEITGREKNSGPGTFKSRPVCAQVLIILG